LSDIKFRTDIRNIAVIAHVDHGKTTLVDSMLRQSGRLSAAQEETERVLDSSDLERERGITILAKNTAITYKDVKINILDTPGHQDFGGEVERMLIMADGVLLLVDAAEGPLPQTRFVLSKALALGLKPIVAINKIDRKDARSAEVLDEVYDLFIDLGAEDEQIDFSVLYTNGRAGFAHYELDDGSEDLTPLFDTIVEKIPAPEDRSEEPLLLQANNLSWDDYVGRIIIGRVLAGTIRAGQPTIVIGEDASRPGKVMRLYTFDGLKREETKEVQSGDIIALAGIDIIEIGDTITDSVKTPPLPRIHVDEPTLAMNFCVNNSPFAGEDGKYVTSRNIRDRLLREERANVAIRVEETATADVYRVIGRGELQLAILVETMRREGFELMLSRPEVVTKKIDDKLHEPVEKLFIDCPQDMVGAVTENVGPRKGALEDMQPVGSRMNLTYRIPTRGLIGFHSEFLTETRGTGIMSTTFDGWIPWQGPITPRRQSAIVADRVGKTTPYALFHIQPRGILMVGPGTRVYEGMVVGQTPRANDIDVNATREKKLTNMRASGKDDNVILSPHKSLSLEQSIEFIAEDELVEVTPKIFRIRKRILRSGQRYKKGGQKEG
jgi:GTP-binding protein